MNANLALTLVAAGLVTIAMAGCGAIVRSNIDTQPRVTMAPDAFATPDAIVHGHAIAYTPDLGTKETDSDLATYAPIIVQGFQPDTSKSDYEFWSDGIGMPHWNPTNQTICVETSTPVVFARVEHASVYGQELKQLTYVFWYPRRPVGIVEAGEVDGGILRVTLDAEGNPAIFEVSQTCGCYHGVFASSGIESQAQAEYGSAPAQRQHALETPSSSSDWIVRDVVDARAGQRPVLYITAGEHFCETLRFTDANQPLNTTDQRSYMLAAYEELGAIASDDGTTISMFNAQKLVRGAKRWKEELMFGGLDHPGWPRHLDAMLIHWDHDRWTDPTLLEHHLRMPHQAVANGADLPQHMSSVSNQSQAH